MRTYVISFILPLEFLSQGHSGGGKLDGVDGVAHEDPDVRDYGCDPGDGMPVRPCEHALHHHTLC